MLSLMTRSERLVELARLVDLELVELQPFEPRIGDLRRRRRSRCSMPPTSIQCARTIENISSSPLIEIGHVDDDVVEVLAGDAPGDW